MPTNQPRPRRVVILGSTGSIGTQTCQVIDHCNALHEQGAYPQRFEIVGIAAGSDSDSLKSQGARFAVRDLALGDTRTQLDESGFNIRRGHDAARRLIEDTKPDLVIGAIVGIAGLDSVLCAIELGIDVALANKESLVAAGEIVIRAARASGARILPLDSEHAGVWQCLLGVLGSEYTPPAPATGEIARITLTASGGPFRDWSLDRVRSATRADALNHPNWSMGDKVSIDSATLMNKGLELIEAHWLFDVNTDRLDALIHPQSVIHAIVECADHSMIAQLGAPDMRCPIQHALCYPHRTKGVSNTLDLQTLSRLDFEPIDHERFPAIRLALDAIDAGGTSGAILNAANEIAVHAFLEHQIGFARIAEIVAETIANTPSAPINTIRDVLDADSRARGYAQSLLTTSPGIVR